jgi:hypothetical protein
MTLDIEIIARDAGNTLRLPAALQGTAQMKRSKTFDICTILPLLRPSRGENDLEVNWLLAVKPRLGVQRGPAILLVQS